MATIHIVEQGECLSSIAANYGFPDWHVVYDDPNNADFRALRPDPNLIYPGDQLYIPDPRIREEPCQTDRLHCFQVTFQPTYFNVRVRDLGDQPIANAPYRLNLTNLGVTGTTDDQGWIRCKIPAQSEFGTLMVWPNPADQETVIAWSLYVGHLDPLETITGVKARLNNLGYDCGDVNSIQDEEYESAVRQFQTDYGLKVDGIVGPQTRGKLKQEHLV